jgi:hypothetical protein
VSKGGRLRARKKPEALSEQALINGWSDAGGVRVRQARAGDLPATAELVPLAGVRLEDVLREAVTADIAGAALRSGLRGGAGAFHRHLAEQFARHLDDPLQAYLHAIGAALLKRCRQIYVHCGYLLLYGAMPPTPGLSAFYRRQGFDVIEAGAPLDLWMVFGVHSRILPGAGERFFFRRFQPSR